MRHWLACLVAFGCGDNGGVKFDASVDSPDFACAPGEIAQSFATRAYGTMGGPLDGARLCLAGTTRCTTSAAGTAVLCVPSATDYGIQVAHEDFESAVYLIGGNATALVTLEIGDNDFVTTLWEDSGGTFPPPDTSGLLFVGALPETVTVTISPSVGTVTYGRGSDQVADSTLTATSASGTAYIGDLPEGDYDITIAPPMTCANISGVGMNAATGGWASPTVGANTRVPIIAGATTVSLLDCQ